MIMNISTDVYLSKPSFLEIYGNNKGTEDPPIHLDLPECQQKVLSVFDTYPTFYFKCLEDLALQQKKLTRIECVYAMGAIIAIAIMENHSTEIATISNEKIRNLKITELTGLAAEKDLTSGDSKEEVLKSLLLIINGLKEIYLSHCHLDNSWAFFQNAFVGPPCLNGRIITMINYSKLMRQTSISGNSESVSLLEQSSVFDLPTEYDGIACIFESLMYNYENAKFLPDENDKPPPLEDFILFLKKHDDYELKLKIHVEGGNFDKIYKRACLFFVK